MATSPPQQFTLSRQAVRPQQFLNFFPLPDGLEDTTWPVGLATVAEVKATRHIEIAGPPTLSLRL
jgi:hypothetical protein